MTLEEQLKDVTARNEQNLTELREKVSEDLKQAKHYANVLQRSEKDLSSAKSRVLKEKVKLAEKYITDSISKSVKVPKSWDGKRVSELRRILASGSEKTVEARCAKLAALRELQLYLEAFPIIERVADLVRKWTGCDDIEVKSNGNYEQTLFVKGQPMLELDMCQWEVWDHGLRKISTSNIYLYPTVEYLDSSGNGARIADFWELHCRLSLLDPKFIVGFEECEKWCGSGQHVMEYADGIRNLGKSDFIMDRYSSSLGSKVYEETLAAAVIINSVWMLPISMCVSAAKYMPSDSREFLESDLQSRFNYQFREDLKTGKGEIKFDLKKCEVLCKSDVDVDMTFDPDTCEMVHQSLTWEHIPVGDVRIRDLHDYVAKQVPWIEPYGSFVLDVEASSDIVKAVKEQGEAIFIHPLRVGSDIVQVKPTDKGRYAIKVDIKVPVKDLRSEMSCYGFNGKSFKMYERHHETCGLFLSFEKQKG